MTRKQKETDRVLRRMKMVAYLATMAEYEIVDDKVVLNAGTSRTDLFRLEDIETAIGIVVDQRRRWNEMLVNHVKETFTMAEFQKVIDEFYRLFPEYDITKGGRS